MKEIEKFHFTKINFKKILYNLRLIPHSIYTEDILRKINSLKDKNCNFIGLNIHDLSKDEIHCLRKSIIELYIFNEQNVSGQEIAMLFLKNENFRKKVNIKDLEYDCDSFMWNLLLKSIGCSIKETMKNLNLTPFGQFKYLQEMILFLPTKNCHGKIWMNQKEIKNWQSLKYEMLQIRPFIQLKDFLSQYVNLVMVATVMPMIVKKYFTGKFTFQSKLESQTKICNKFQKFIKSVEVQSYFLSK